MFVIYTLPIYKQIVVERTKFTTYVHQHVHDKHAEEAQINKLVHQTQNQVLHNANPLVDVKMVISEISIMNVYAQNNAVCKF